MKVVEVFRVTGRGDAMLTDAPFTSQLWAKLCSRLKTGMKLRIGSVHEFDVIGVEAVLKTSKEEFIGFLVAPISDQAVRTALIGEAIEVI